MLPGPRVQQIARIFSYFKNPDKETVLTPWRVVNVHLSDTLGGWCFFNDDHESADTHDGRARTPAAPRSQLLDEPRFVDRGEVTSKVFDPKTKILEINSKSGLYPLYVTYSIYRRKFGAFTEADIDNPLKCWQKWKETVADNVYVICKTPMAAAITRRTLVGYMTATVNARTFDGDLIETLKTKAETFTKKISTGKFWGKEDKEMKFDAIVGNPPYQVIDGGHASSALPIYHEFVSAGVALVPEYLSMIIPARWFSGGRGLDKFRAKMLTDKRIRLIHDYVDPAECFPSIDLSGGVCYFLWSCRHVGDCQVVSHLNGKTTSTTRPLLEQDGDTFVRFNQAVSVLRKVMADGFASLTSRMTANDPFGYDVRVENSYKRVKPDIKERAFSGSVQIYYYGDGDRRLGFIKRSSVRKNKELIDIVKVLISASYGERGDYPYQVVGTPFVASNGEVCTETYLCFRGFANRTECMNFITYVKTRMFRFLVMLKKQTQHAPPSVYAYVPIQDFSEPWDDEKLYAKYGITPAEQKFIESMIKPME